MADFKIGGRIIPVPPLNLTAQRLALRELPGAFKAAQPVVNVQRGTDIEVITSVMPELLAQAEQDAPVTISPIILATLLRLAAPTVEEGAYTEGNPDALIDTFLRVLEARLKTHPNEEFRLTAEQLQDQIEGAEELGALNTSMNALLVESGFTPSGEAGLAAAGAAAPASTPTPSSTGSLSPSYAQEEKAAAGG